jgi:precorrin isomerase
VLAKRRAAGPVDIADKLGFKKAVVAEISQHVYSDPTITADRDMVKTKAMKFLKSKDPS